MMQTSERIDCPVDGCDWSHTEPPIDPRVDANTLAGVFGPGVMANVAANRRAEKIERILSDHFKTHSVLDYIRTITRLREQVVTLERRVSKRGSCLESIYSELVNKGSRFGSMIDWASDGLNA